MRNPPPPKFPRGGWVVAAAAGPRRQQHPIHQLFLLLLVLAVGQLDCGGLSEKPLLLTSDHELGDFVISPQHHNTIYVGGTNVLYQLGWSDLKVKQKVETGPQLDHVRCHASGDCDPKAVKTLTDNVNKAMVVDRENDKLIVCGSVRQGACSKYDLGNISGQAVFVPQSVAANTKDASTFAFIGPQRYNRWGHSNVLYVGTTFTGNADYRHDVPAISSRNLENLHFAENAFSNSWVRVDVKYRDRFFVNYVYGFNSSSHVYFVTLQKRSHLSGEEEKGYVTRLARVCVTDANYDTYTEVTLDCAGSGSGNGGKKYNVVRDAFFVERSQVLSGIYGKTRDDSFLVGSFGASVGSSTKTSADSAVCVFSLSHIDQMFEENIENCLSGATPHRNLEYIAGKFHEGRCPEPTSSKKTVDYCDVGSKISGNVPITVEPYQMFSQSVTSVHFEELSANGGGGGGAVLILGTAVGRLMVVLISSVSGAKMLSNHQLSERTAVTKVQLVGNYVVALQSHTLTKLLASDCQKHTSCSTCVSSNDPFCGWCAFRNKCSHLSDCLPHHNVSQWFSVSTRQCSHVEEVIPSSISIPSEAAASASSAASQQQPHLTLLIPSLPTLPVDEHFVCVYGNSSVVRAKTIQRGLKCQIPTSSAAFKAYVSQPEDRTSVRLDIKFADLGTTLLTTRVPLLKCGRENSCQSCTRHSQCSWCMESNTCVARASNQCFQSVRGSREGTSSPSCPLLKKSITPLKIPNDVPIQLRLPFVHLPSFYHKERSPFWCMVQIEEAKLKVSARMIWENSTVVCDETVYNYNAAKEQIEAEVSVMVNHQNYILDSKKLTIFKCGVLGSYKSSQDCSLCMTRTASHGCTWCGNQCTSQRACQSNFTHCPGPEIFLIQPTSGPLEGGTVLTIEGSNLGNTLQDVRGRIKIGNRNCSLLNLKNSVEVTCLTPPVRRQREMPVTLFSKRGQIQSRVRFKYLDFQVISFSPSKGSISGGSLLKIRGKNLSIGSKVMVYLDEVACAVDPRQTTANSLVCRTGFVQQERVTQNLTVVIDGGVRQIHSPFFYTPNPEIHNVKPLKSFYSGGRVVTVVGRYFDSVSSSNFLVYDENGAVFESSCHIYNSKLMECKTPSVKKAVEGRRSTPPPKSLDLRIGLRMDNVTSLLELYNPYTNRNYLLHYVQDPRYVNFTNSLKLYNGDALVIEGDRLNVASDESDVRVTIGDEYCNITAITKNQLLCDPPPSQPPPAAGTADADLPELTVHVGPSLRYHLGYVQYNLAHNEEDLMSSEIIGAISAVTAILVAVGIVVLIVMKHKSSQVEREYKRIQIQMDLLENNVRSECKQAFAELQTDMTDLTMELETTGIPFIAHRKYVMNVFFPGVLDHPVLLKQLPEWQNSNSMFGFSMVQFEQLLMNKTFLITLIDTVERQPSFGIRDRVNFASLLSIVLMTKMDYFSDVLKTLLVRLMDRSLCSRHPQLMLRRTETVVEKLLTNWLALCMYDYIESRAGSSLFLLHKAIKCQVEKGPVDQYTQESKYALSEEGLLREACDYSVVTCLVMQRELEEAYQAKVLDCDSITQVKAKILNAVYKNTPFSVRPPVHEIDLEWQCGQDAHVVLQDFDLTSKEEPGGLRRVNTLRHYGIKNKAVVSLVPRQHHHQHFIGGGGGNANNTLKTNNIYEEIPSNPYSQNTLLNPSTSSSASGGVIGGGVSSGIGSASSGGGSGAYHLRIPDNLGMSSSSTDRLTVKSNKTIPEVYLTRLLSTKGTIKKFIDDFFITILSVDDVSGGGGQAPPSSPHSPTCASASAAAADGGSNGNNYCDFPPAVKWLFDLFDESLRAGLVDDPSIVHCWKSNSVPLRFWINLIKNPDFVFDVEKTPATDLNLSIVAQTLMSACLTSAAGADDLKVSLNKESPSHKLLFARDIVHYRHRISDFYDRVATLPTVTDQELHCYMNRLSQMHDGEFNQMAALKEIFLYVSQYYHELSLAFNNGAGNDSGNGTLVGSGTGNGTFVPSPTMSYNNAAAMTMQQQQTNRDLSLKLEHIFKIVKESDYVR